MNPAKAATADPELAIWERVFVPDPQHITPDQARYLLQVRFPQADVDRINELSAKAQEGTLTAAEETELDCYVHVGHLLSILKAKVRGKVEKMNDDS
jgi:hypothetical protein